MCRRKFRVSGPEEGHRICEEGGVVRKVVGNLLGWFKSVKSRKEVIETGWKGENRYSAV